jgi:glycosyltransferase involved in cell wall biosynthesis
MLVGKSSFLRYGHNSSVTSSYIKETNPEVNPLTIFPPVRIADSIIPDKKPIQIAAIGAFRPNKRFGDIIRALFLSKQQDLKLIIVGLLDNDDYLDYLRRLVRNLGLQNRVLLIPNATDAIIRKVLAESSMIVSAARFEPFGISIVEGMGNGCVPIVFAGKDSGPWVDIIQKGKYGYGFKSVNELSEILQRVSNDVSENVRLGLKVRALQFNSLTFKDRIKNLFNGDLN